MQGRTCDRVKVYINSVDILSIIVSVGLLPSHLFTVYTVYFPIEKTEAVKIY
jgi:hypothetical protein